MTAVDVEQAVAMGSSCLSESDIRRMYAGGLVRHDDGTWGPADRGWLHVPCPLCAVGRGTHCYRPSRPTWHDDPHPERVALALQRGIHPR